MKDNNDMKLLKEFAVGFENIFESILGANRINYKVNFPKKNVVQTSENSYRIDFSLAGYQKEQVKIFVDTESNLNVKSEKVEATSDENEYPKFLVREVAQRAFHVKLKLIDLEVENAKMENGILSIFIKRREFSKNENHIAID